MALEKFLGKAFARFELSCGFGWTENGPPSAIELVHDTKGQRKFRADDREVGLQTNGKLSDGIEAFQVSGKALGLIGDPPVAGSAIKLRNARGLLQLPHQRMSRPPPPRTRTFIAEQIRLGVEG